MANEFGITTGDSFDIDMLNSVWDNFVANYGIDATHTAETWFAEMDTNEDGQVTFYPELCQGLIGYAFCGDQGSDDSTDGEEDWEAREYERMFIIQWYRIDTDQDEVINEADLRAVKYATYTDE